MTDISQEEKSIKLNDEELDKVNGGFNDGLDKKITVIINNILCINCGNCANLCPNGCITPGDYGYEVDLRDCSGCGTCASVCPMGAIYVDYCLC